MADTDEREEELETLSAIYPELTFDTDDKFTASLELAVSPSKPLYIRFVPSTNRETDGGASYAQTARATAAHIECDVQFSHLPPVKLQVTLSAQYPADAPPTVRLTTQQEWLPKSKLAELEQEVVNLWEDYGRCQILFAYIDYLQQSAERGFDLDQSEGAGCLVLRSTAERALAEFDAVTTVCLFNAGTYGCGICLEPKKGSSCFKLARCGHVFCKECLQDFYNNAITEGDVAGVRCLSPDCGKETQNGRKRKRRNERTLHPRDLLAIGIEEGMVRRYVELKRKKKLEADKTTVYCPRTWCQGPARSPKYPPIPADLAGYDMAETSSEEESDGEHRDVGPRQSKAQDPSKIPPDPSDRLAICEKCELAFCRVCFMGWHGPFARCFPRDPSELSAEEKASYDYIRTHTSPCPTCSSPTQKTMGCNHMRCFQCNSHFCYLCGSWLDGQNPYQHFNRAGTECYQRLWELEEGDEGQGPGDGRGFAGGRGWEQIAIEVAREADEREAEEAARAAQDQERRLGEQAGRPGQGDGAGEPPTALDDPNALVEPLELELVEDAVLAAMADVQVNEEPEAPREPRRPPRQPRPRNPFPHAAPAPAERAQAIRNYERNQGRPLRGGIRGLNAHGNGRRRDRNRVGIEHDEDDRDDPVDGEDAQGRYVVLEVGPERRPMRVHHWHPLF